MKYVFLLLIAMCTSTPALADSAPCTSTQSAVVSHFVTHNNEYGGHVNAHVYGQTPPAGYTQNNKTMFANDQYYAQAWDALTQQNPPLYCSNNPQVGNEAARSITFQLASRQCTAANPAGICTAYNNVNTGYVRFTFRAVPKGPGSLGAKWILYVAYPASTP